MGSVKDLWARQKKKKRPPASIHTKANANKKPNLKPFPHTVLKYRTIEKLWIIEYRLVIFWSKHRILKIIICDTKTVQAQRNETYLF